MSSVTNGASQLLRFQVMKCEASELLTTSQAWMLLENSWPSRWNSRSEPERSICTSMPGYFASNALPSFSPTGRSIDEYRITLPSFFAASIRSGVIETGSGPRASTRVDERRQPKRRRGFDDFAPGDCLSHRVRSLRVIARSEATKQSSLPL